MAVGNFTPDTIIWQWQGKGGKIRPGEIITDKDRGWENHVLNRWGMLGLVRLDYGDDPDQRKEESMRLYTRFWEHQIQTFNEQNEQLKNEGRAYVAPAKELKAKAAEFGIKLVGPWTIEELRERSPDKSNSKPDPKVEGRIESLEKDMGGIKGQLDDVYNMLKGMLEKDAAEENDTEPPKKAAAKK